MHIHRHKQLFHPRPIQGRSPPKVLLLVIFLSPTSCYQAFTPWNLWSMSGQLLYLQARGWWLQLIMHVVLLRLNRMSGAPPIWFHMGCLHWRGSMCGDRSRSTWSHPAFLWPQVLCCNTSQPGSLSLIGPWRDVPRNAAGQFLLPQRPLLVFSLSLWILPFLHCYFLWHLGRKSKVHCFWGVIAFLQYAPKNRRPPKWRVSYKIPEKSLK